MNITAAITYSKTTDLNQNFQAKFQEKCWLSWSVMFFRLSELLKRHNNWEFRTKGGVSFSLVLGHPLFLYVASNAFPDIGSVGRIQKNKNKNKNLQEVSRSETPGGPGPQDDVKIKVNIHIIIWINKIQNILQKNVPVFSLCCYYAHFSDKKDYFKWKMV